MARPRFFNLEAECSAALRGEFGETVLVEPRDTGEFSQRADPDRPPVRLEDALISFTEPSARSIPTVDLKVSYVEGELQLDHDQLPYDLKIGDVITLLERAGQPRMEIRRGEVDHNATYRTYKFGPTSATAT